MSFQKCPTNEPQLVNPCFPNYVDNQNTNSQRHTVLVKFRKDLQIFFEKNGAQNVGRRIGLHTVCLPLCFGDTQFKPNFNMHFFTHSTYTRDAKNEEDAVTLSSLRFRIIVFLSSLHRLNEITRCMKTEIQGHTSKTVFPCRILCMDNKSNNIKLSEQIILILKIKLFIKIGQGMFT